MSVDTLVFLLETVDTWSSFLKSLTRIKRQLVDAAAVAVLVWP